METKMISIIKQKNKIQSPKGEFIFDRQYIIHSIIDEKEIDADFLMFPLIFNNHYNPMTTLKRLDISIQEFLNTKYHCPFNNMNTLYGIVPIGINTKNSSIYRVGGFVQDHSNYIFDLHFQKKNINQILSTQSPIEISFLGSGYTDYFLPTDGTIRTTCVKIELSNKDFIIAKTFQWSNK
jgi:hypothetical protein